MPDLKLRLVIFILFTCTITVFGQRYNFEQYDIQNGLVQSQVTGITQDKQNRLWIATLGGLSRFNGTEFTNLSKTDGLNSNFILSIAFSRDGHLLIGTDRGLSIYKSDSLYNYKGAKVWTEGLSISASGNMYGLSERNLVKIDGIKTTPIYLTGDTSEMVTAIKTDDTGKTWAAVYKHGLYYQEGNQWHKKTLGKKADELIINNLLIDNFTKDKIWLLTTDGLYTAYNGEIKRAYAETIKKVTAMSQDEEGNIWLGTNRGAWLIADGKLIHFNAKNGFTDNVVNRIFRDKENNIWLGTDGSGIYKYNSKNYVTYDESQGLQNSIVMSIINGPAPNEIWIGTYSGLFVHKNNKIQRIVIPSDDEDVKRINFLFKDSDLNIWIGTAGGGLWRYKDKTFKRLDKGSRAFYSNAIVEDRHKNKWISTNLGCFVVDHHTKSISRITERDCTSLLEIGNNMMIIGTQNGASLIRNKTNISPLTFKPIAGSSILSMIKHGDHIFFGTSDNGLVIWNLSTGKTKQINTKNGLSSDHIYSLLLDKKGVIWVGTGRGINKISVKDFKILRNENTLLVECNQNAILENGDNIWVGTTKGALVFNNNHKLSAIKKPHVFINSVSILPQNNKISQNTVQVTYNEYELGEKIVLPYNHNHLNISFTGIYLTDPKTVTYQYRLRGLDHNYSRLSTNSSVNYTALPPGNYTFQVRAVTQSGIRSSNIASFKLQIPPPYYQTTIFKIFILSVILLLVMILVYVIINLNERQRKLRLKIKLEEQFKVRKQTAEDFHDDIGNKLTRISVLSEVLSSMTDKNDHEKRAVIQKIKTNVNELYRGTKDILWSLDPKNDTLEDLLMNIKTFGAEMFEETSIRFEDEIHINNTPKKLPLELSRNILMIFKEAINNALKYAKADRVVFTAKMTDNLLAIQLSDNGAGFDTASAKNGRGLNNMQVRAERIKGNLTITSTTKGTSIALSIKL